MPKYRIKMILANPERELVTNITGCRDEDHCVEKAQGLYNIKRVVFVDLAEDDRGLKPVAPVPVAPSEIEM